MSLDRAELTAATRPLNRARSMPAGFYTDPAIFKAERAQVFLKHWFFLTRTEELPEPGDYRAFDSPGGPIVLIRGTDGRLRCFANYCRHRGSILLEGKGNVGGKITCPYHAWSYLNDGRLYGCPDMKDAEGFDKVENGLVALDLDEWEGFVFARFTRDGPTLRDHLGDFPERMASHQLGRMRSTWSVTPRMSASAKSRSNAPSEVSTGASRDSAGCRERRRISLRQRLRAMVKSQVENLEATR